MDTAADCEECDEDVLFYYYYYYYYPGGWGGFLNHVYANIMVVVMAC